MVAPMGAAQKLPTGVEGLDQLLRGGVPVGAVTLVAGGPGCGKTLLALRTAARAAEQGDHAVFVSFEEPGERIMRNASAFGWELPRLVAEGRLAFVDAAPDPDTIVSGDFELEGMLAVLGARVDAVGARCIVLDALDVVLALAHDDRTLRREMGRLHAWLSKRDVVALITSRSEPADDPTIRRLSFFDYMVDCGVSLIHRVVEGTSYRAVRVMKYRGSEFDENEEPFLITSSGLEVVSLSPREEQPASITRERLSSGIETLDEMLGGGFHRAASVLVTGIPGTAKTTLATCFADASCARGERVLYVSFDSRPHEVIRDVSSVGVELARWLEDDERLRVVGMRGLASNAHSHLLTIVQLAREHAATVVVVDPLSALSKQGGFSASEGMAERLVDWTKAAGMTLLCTSLVDANDTPERQATPLQISTVADTWIHLSNHAHAGERNRGLSIVKSRGTSHSNQIRELLLSDEGIELADVYTAEGEVLMGTLRFQREQAEELARERAAEAEALNRRRTEMRVAELEAKLAALRHELSLRQQELEAGPDATARWRERQPQMVRTKRQVHQGPKHDDES